MANDRVAIFVGPPGHVIVLRNVVRKSEDARRQAEMSDEIYPKATHELARMRRALAPEADAAFHEFSQAVFADGALSRKTKHLIAVAVAHVTQCPYCIKGHTGAALRDGATNPELMEAIWVAAEMRAGAAFAHSVLALAEMERFREGQRDEQRA
jgi:AhpD family alkylhydroperoxidase